MRGHCLDVAKEEDMIAASMWRREFESECSDVPRWVMLVMVVDGQMKMGEGV